MNCPLSDTPSEFLVRGEGREYRFCPECALVFVPQKYFIDPADEKKRYLEHNNSLESEGYVAMFQKKIALIKKLCPGTTTILDYGCGYEPVLKVLLERQGYEVDTYDAIFFPDPPAKDDYDLIVSTETFEHFKKPGEEIERLTSRIAPQGGLAVMTRFYPLVSGRVSVESFSQWYYKRDPTHIAFYSDKTFVWIANRYGLRVIYNNQNDFVVLKK